MWRGLWFRYLRLTGSAHSELWNGSVFLLKYSSFLNGLFSV